jgi:PKD repeat protein
MTWQLVYAGVPIELYGPTPEFTFDRPGVYNVNLVVFDMVGNTGSDHMRVTVLDVTTPTAVAGTDITIDQGAIVNLDGSASSDNVAIVAWKWTLNRGDDVSTFEGEKTAISLNDAGVYHVTLNVTDAAGNWGENGFTITVRDTTDPVADAGEDQTIGQGLTVNLDGTNSTDNVGIISYSWTIIEGEERITKTGPNTTHVFEWSGTYTVELTVLDAAGLTDTTEMMVIVLDTELPIAAPGEAQSVKEGEEVFLNASLSRDNEGIAKYTWTFNYNQAQVELVGPIVSHTFQLQGTYTVTLTVEDLSGNTATNTTTVSVLGEDDGGGDGIIDSTFNLIPYILLATVIAVGLLVIYTLARRKTQKDAQDFGWKPTEEERVAREEDETEGDDEEDEGSDDDETPAEGSEQDGSEDSEDDDEIEDD